MDDETFLKEISYDVNLIIMDNLNSENDFEFYANEIEIFIRTKKKIANCYYDVKMDKNNFFLTIEKWFEINLKRS